MQDQWNSVDEYVRELFSLSDPVLEVALEASVAAGFAPLQVSPAQGKMLMILAQMHGARRILELGTLGGYSTIWLGRALPAGGRLVSLEASARHAEVDSGKGAAARRA